MTAGYRKAAPVRSVPLGVRIFPFLSWMKTVDCGTLKADLLAGLTGAFIVLPQGVSFAMIAGLPAQYGLYAAIVPPVIAALFGSSMHLVSGPTTAISIIVFSTLSPLADPGSADYVRLALTLTFMAGLFQLAFGLARLGTLINFVSHSVIVGFTAGAADDVEPRHLLIIGYGINFIDVSGSLVLEQEAHRRQKLGKHLFLCRLNHGVIQFLVHGGFLKQIGKKQMEPSMKFRTVFPKTAQRFF